MKPIVPRLDVTRMVILLILSLPLIMTGCSPPAGDQQMIELGREAMQQQQKQNEIIARQSERVVDETEKLTEAARDLVTQDAQARREMVAAQENLNKDLHTERASLDRQREDLEEDRRSLATARVRDPIIARAIQTAGILLACLAPLLLAAYLLYSLRSDTTDDQAVAELLVCELTTDQPKLLPMSRARVAALEHKSSGDPDPSEAGEASSAE